MGLANDDVPEGACAPFGSLQARPAAAVRPPTNELAQWPCRRLLTKHTHMKSLWRRAPLPTYLTYLRRGHLPLIPPNMYGP